MLSKNRILCAMIGGVMVALPIRAVAADHLDSNALARAHAARIESSVAPRTQLADDEHHRWRHHDDDDDYDWGGHHRYQYPPSYFAAPPPARYGMSDRRAWLVERRRNAEYMKRRMMAQGDSKAADRLQGEIDHLNTQIRRTR